jgi:sulfur-oxidizing protein SoxY
MTSRREFLVLAAGALSGAAHAQLPADIGAKRKAAAEEALRKVTGGAQLQSGKVRLDIPPLIDNGNAVPLTVTVESPMTETDYVKAIHVLTEKNPQPNVVAAYLGPRAGRAAVTTRVRLADTQKVTAIAQLSDGTFWVDRVDVVVTLSACLEDGLI